MGYLSVQDYGVIGNQTSAALVSRLGSIDWCCLPYLDSASHFGALLDDQRGGRFQLVPAGDFRSEQRYPQRTHVLETVFETPDGRAVLTDWMPVGNGSAEDPSICRRIEVIDGQITWNMLCAPSFDYGRELARAEHFRDGILFRGRRAGEIAQLRSEIPLELSRDGTAAVARFTVEAPAQVRFRWAWGRRAEAPLVADPFDAIEWWRNFAHRCPAEGSCPVSGPWHDLVARAGLTLKLLLAPYSGALAEAITTSIPGASDRGGPHRTWDFRYGWIRDAATTLRALDALGYRREADAHFAWLCDLLVRDGALSLQRVYTLDGGRELPELELEHLNGYRGVKPVRVGNIAPGQFHVDVYGHVALAAWEHLSQGGEVPERAFESLCAIADYLCQAWRRPDHGPWETRGKPEHWVSSKVMSWVALDRVIRLSRARGRDVPPRWEQERDVLHRTILLQGYDDARGTFTRAFSDPELDASVLIVPLVGFLPPDDPRVLTTLNAVQETLSEGALLHRWRASQDGPEPEGAHLPSSFHLVAALAICGRVDEAADRLTELCTYATGLGFFGDQVGPDGETSGNFPSASAQVALINAGLQIGRARGLLAPPELGLPGTRAAARHRRPFRPLRRAG